jgi:16S rRNA (uracil1498-N3)-methyltransferase
VHKFVPIIAARSEKTDINLDRAQKIIVEAAEQCGRGDIPELREPIGLHEALEEYKDLPLYICEQHSTSAQAMLELEKVGVLIGPEGGWTDEEKELFASLQLPHIMLSTFTLRAETAAVVAVANILQNN